ncbi:MFS transporter [Streptomyces sp. ME19-03-3]|nr:MFS transporter [Streptomyces sp. ME19-03-3]
MATLETAVDPRPALRALALRGRASAVTLALVAFAQPIISVDYDIVYVALPQIGSGLGFSAQHLRWVISAYAVSFGGFLLLGGRACDLFGPRRTFVLGLSLYGVSSPAGGLATGPSLLIAARAVQGVGGAFFFPATLTLVGTLFAEGRERNRAYSVWGAAGGSGLIVGALLGGVLTQLFGWRSVLYVNLPLALIAVVAAFRLITPNTARRAGRRTDLPGALTSTLGVTGPVVALVQGLVCRVATSSNAAGTSAMRRRPPVARPAWRSRPALPSATCASLSSWSRPRWRSGDCPAPTWPGALRRSHRTPPRAGGAIRRHRRTV